MSMIDAEILTEILPDGWEAGAFGDTLICPCGDEIEMDGTCPQGHQSPLPF